MDELVFLRETLRRSLLAAAEQLEKAAEGYDPEATPTEDIVGAVAVSMGLQVEVQKYTEMVVHRVRQRSTT